MGIEQTVYVARPQHKALCLGKGGAMIKQGREAALAELSVILGAKAHLFIFVKVREKWIDDPERYRTWGLEFDG